MSERATMQGAFEALARRGHRFETVIDVGASNGSWSLALMEHFPRAQYLLIEAQPVHEPALQALAARHSNWQFTLKAAGAQPGRLHFHAGDPFGGQASNEPHEENDIEVPVTTIDSEVESRMLSGPFLVKLDTHGFEVPILAGAEKTLRTTEILVVECYNYRISPECILFHEMCALLDQLGFRCIDLVDPLFRPRDDTFWQMDLLFAPKSRPEFSYDSYR